MAGPGDPFTPGPTVDPTAGIPGMDTFEALRNQWATFLDQPGARTALLQAGASLLQPPSFGETAAGQIGRAISEGGAAVSRGEAQQSLMQEREARAQAAEARAGQAGERLGLEHFRRQSIEQVQEANRQQRAFQTYISDQANVNRIYNQRKQAWAKGEENARLTGTPNPFPDPGPPPPPLDFPTWLRVRGAGILSAGTLAQQPRQQQPQQTTTEPETETE